jgi:hypothetical protein
VGSRAIQLSEAILKEVDEILQSYPEKLVAQGYNGASVMSGETGGVQATVKQRYANAHYVHRYAHQLNLVTQQATGQVPEVRLFFVNLSAFL